MRLTVQDEVMAHKRVFTLEITDDELIQAHMSPKLNKVLNTINTASCPICVRLLGLAAMVKAIEEFNKTTDYDNETPLGQQYLDGFDDGDLI